jgi:hypothetical protein
VQEALLPLKLALLRAAQAPAAAVAQPAMQQEQ